MIVGVDLFAGAGGMSLAASRAGVKIVYAVEICPKAAATYRLNFPTVPVHVGDIRNVKQLPDRPNGAVTILFGGPPCQGFSTSNQRTRNGQNPDNWLFTEFARLVRLWKPDWVVMENVKGIVETEGGRFLDYAIGSLEEFGYSTSFGLLNAVEFGVPQARTRAFVIGSLFRPDYTLPLPPGRGHVTVSDAIRDLPSLANGARRDEMPYGSTRPSHYARDLRNSAKTVTGNLVTKNAPHIVRRYRYVPQGGNWENIPRRLLAEYANPDRCHTGIYRRLDSSRPSVVIGNYRKNMLIHPRENRGLSVREAARIQSVPDWFRFSGSIGFQQQQVGNMVPPLLGRAIFESIRRATTNQ